MPGSIAFKPAAVPSGTDITGPGRAVPHHATLGNNISLSRKTFDFSITFNTASFYIHRHERRHPFIRIITGNGQA
jgi:hypothetical protein